MFWWVVSKFVPCIGFSYPEFSRAPLSFGSGALFLNRFESCFMITLHNRITVILNMIDAWTYQNILHKMRKVWLLLCAARISDLLNYLVTIPLRLTLMKDCFGKYMFFGTLRSADILPTTQFQLANSCKDCWPFPLPFHILITDWIFVEWKCHSLGRIA